MKDIVNSSQKAIKWLNSAHLICDIYSGFLNPILPFIAVKLGFTMAIATVIAAIVQICSNLLQPIFGFFADNILKRFFIFWGVILAAVFIPLAPAASNIFILVLFMILGSLGSSFFHPQAIGFVNFFSKENCTNNMGSFVAFGSLGAAIGPLLATYIVQISNLDNISYTSILGLICAGLMFFFVPKLSLTETKPKSKKIIESFKEILLNQQMRILIMIAMLKSLVTSSSCILLPFLWKSMEHTPFYIGFALFLFVFSGSIGSLLSPYIEKIIGTKIVLCFSMIGTFPMIILFAFTYKTFPTLSLIIFGLIGFVTMLAQPIILVLAQQVMPKYKSIVAGFINGFCWGIVALGLSFLGSIAEVFGIVNTLIVLSTVPVIFSYILKDLTINNK